MSYMLLFKNKNGAVIAADTRMLNISMIPVRKTDNGKKLVYSNVFKFAITILGTGSFINQAGECIYIQDYLERHIIKAEANREFFSKQNFSKFLLAFLYGLTQSNALSIDEISQLNTVFTGVQLKDGLFETIEVKVSDLVPSLINLPVLSQLNNICQYKQHPTDESVVISGGDHILAWISGKKDLPTAQFISEYSTRISNYSLEQLKKLAEDTINAIIQYRQDPSIGGHVDIVTIDNIGNIQARIYNANRATDSSLQVDFSNPSNHLSLKDSAIEIWQSYKNPSDIPDEKVTSYRHHLDFMQHEYDKRFGLILKI